MEKNEIDVKIREEFESRRKKVNDEVERFYISKEQNGNKYNYIMSLFDSVLDMKIEKSEIHIKKIQFFIKANLLENTNLFKTAKQMSDIYNFLLKNAVDSVEEEEKVKILSMFNTPEIIEEFNKKMKNEKIKTGERIKKYSIKVAIIFGIIVVIAWIALMILNQPMDSSQVSNNNYNENYNYKEEKTLETMKLELDSRMQNEINDLNSKIQNTETLESIDMNTVNAFILYNNTTYEIKAISYLCSNTSMNQIYTINSYGDEYIKDGATIGLVVNEAGETIYIDTINGETILYDVQIMYQYGKKDREDKSFSLISYSSKFKKWEIVEV